MTTQEIAVRSEPTALTISADQQGFSDTQVKALLRMIGVEDAPQAELDVFFHVAKRSGLDPFAKQIYMIARQVSVKDEKTGKWSKENRYAIQTGIDGFRLNGRRAADRAGAALRVEGPYWRGREGGWDDAWVAPMPPAAAKYIVYRDGIPFPHVAMYTEYVQTKSDGSPNSMWAKMGANQLAKCAEAGSWRKAFPDDFAGIEFEGAAQHPVVDGEVVDAAPQRRPAAGTSGLRAAVGLDEEQPIDAEVVQAAEAVEPEQSDAEMAEPITADELKKLGGLLKALDMTDKANNLAWMSNAVGRNEIIGGAKDLTRAEADVVFAALQKVIDQRIADVANGVQA